MTRKFFITDVFAEEKYAGNQLATFVDCANLSDLEMQQIAREINFSETTFILSNEPENGGYPVRIFTPGYEVDFAGHPTLGTAYIIQKHLLGTGTQPESVILNLEVGQIPVNVPKAKSKDEVYWMRQVEPEFGNKLNGQQMATVLGLAPDKIDEAFPIEEVSTGLPFIIVPLKSIEALKQATIEKNIYYDLIDKTWAKGILIFCKEPYEKKQDLAVRVFVDYYGVPEDPATGSGNGCLAAYLIKNRYLKSAKIDITTGQGYEMGRKSTLYLKAAEIDGKFQIDVGGKVVAVAKGNWG